MVALLTSLKGGVCLEYLKEYSILFSYPLHYSHIFIDVCVYPRDIFIYFVVFHLVLTNQLQCCCVNLFTNKICHDLSLVDFSLHVEDWRQ